MLKKKIKKNQFQIKNIKKKTWVLSWLTCCQRYETEITQQEKKQNKSLKT